ncbi:alpha-1,6-mannosylglycoprotein 6-beta-N-acetylglucosaminyltransferase A-like [Chelmon rostratus]|uniref:alpha-1,6-mannosylglycoprotein 6-beta-N-acetylglucosaminyltransferase A-like n=1 Tax=Chelmon rostratus TaxID=109905 RepID=UPI001BE88923|nr:alpha-1,6-mannosylglycoprotein 6-beta-N-acetylglucosaminyltransferase A-like [Chelmon rostratus]
MRKLTHSQRWTLFVLLCIGLMWCLSLPLLIVSNFDQGAIIVTHQHKPRLHENRQIETLSAEDIMKRIVRFADDLLSVVGHSGNFSHPPLLKDYKGELKALQIKTEAEKEKEQMKDDMIKELRSDKLQLQQEVTRLGDLLKLQMATEEKKCQNVKSDDNIQEDKNCPLPPMDGYPECRGKVKWMQKMWKSDPCYSSHGVDGSLCSFLFYLSEVESWCPLYPGRVIPKAPKQKLEVVDEDAVVRESLTGLYPLLGNRAQFRWIQQRISSMETIWVEAGRSFSAKYNLKWKAKHILVHPGVVTDESGVQIAKSAFNGGPLGELVQWSDLISTLYILGHHLYLSPSLPDLKLFLGKSGCPHKNSVEPNLIYTDIIGLKQIKAIFPKTWTEYKCLIRVLDSFGTEADFNHPAWAKKNNLKSPFGSLNLTLMQFNTMFPHTPDNTFLGFVVERPLSSEERERLKSTKRQNQALVYGKRGKFWKGKEAYLDIIHKHLEIHGTADNAALIPRYVKNHGIVKGTEVQSLLRQSKVFVGLSFPYEGPAPLEALANGCPFLNPRLHPPQSRLNSEFFGDKPNIREVTSQNPYVEAIGEPYVWTIDMHNSTDVERALNAILNGSIEPYLPYEFTCEGMLQRVSILIEKQDFCHGTGSWPPLSVLQVVKAEVSTSCQLACQKEGLICEPTFFPHLNNAKNLAIYGIDCNTSAFYDNALVFPAFTNSTKHCLLQADPLLFSCVRSDKSLTRICPCRDYIKDQIALCKACI